MKTKKKVLKHLIPLEIAGMTMFRIGVDTSGLWYQGIEYSLTKLSLQLRPKRF